MEDGFGVSHSIDPLKLQTKLYFLNEQLQMMARDLPPTYQQRLPNELLCALAASLMDGTVFKIVNNLMDIQHVTEKHLFQRRLQLFYKHALELKEIERMYFDPSTRTAHISRLEERQTEEMDEMEKNIIHELDSKVADQQRFLELAGVPGFEVTNDPMKIKVQIRLLDFILRLSTKKVPSL